MNSLYAWYLVVSKTQEFHTILSIIKSVAPLAVAFTLFAVFADIWVEYIRSKYFLKEGSVLVEIKLPKETLKSPLAMELFLSALHQTSGEGSWYDRYWLGKTRHWFSLEMVSAEGQVHFYIWARKSFKDFIATALYAQFPGIEVHDVEDYARSVHYDPVSMKIQAAELMFVKEDAYPIKSYVDYGLDKDPKEEFKIDPIAPLIEYLGSIGANQQAWVQILVRAYKKDDHTKPGHLWKAHDRWREEAQKIVNEMLKRDPKTKIAGEVDEDSGLSKKPTITKSEEEVVTAIERNVTKLGFDVGIRLMYIAKNENFSSGGLGGLLSSWKQFGHEHMNGLRPNDDLWSRRLSYPWHERPAVIEHIARQSLAMYKRRSFFYKPYRHIPSHPLVGPKATKPMIMSSESLATIFHFPGGVVATPSFQRVPSKKSEAPANLPV